MSSKQEGCIRKSFTKIPGKCIKKANSQIEFHVEFKEDFLVLVNYLNLIETSTVVCCVDRKDP